RGRCSGRGNQKKAPPKRKLITKDSILIVTAPLTPQNQYPDSNIYASASQQPYYQKPQHESPSLYLRDRSVPVRSIEWPQTPICRFSVSNSLKPSTPHLTQYLGPRCSQTSHSTEEQDNDIAKNRRGLKYP
ncbi:hypothetical protein GcC1_204041, partial [Golovinomyces cichoracearum]